MKRPPAVAGQFYTSDPDELKVQISELTAGDIKKSKRTACVVPHAGYMYSGKTCGKVLSIIEIPDTAVICSPNHSGMGAEISVWSEDAWETPLGEIPINNTLRDRISSVDSASPDTAAHMYEHSIEVILPFLQVLNPDISIVPVTIRSHNPDILVNFGKSLAGILENELLIASSDMTHQEPAEQARGKDELCIGHMVDVDPEGLFSLVMGRGITMCGVSPVTALLSYCREKGLEEGTLVEYTNSGEAFGDFSRVVGYAGLVF